MTETILEQAHAEVREELYRDRVAAIARPRLVKALTATRERLEAIGDRIPQTEEEQTEAMEAARECNERRLEAHRRWVAEGAKYRAAARAAATERMELLEEREALTVKLAAIEQQLGDLRGESHV
jgi:hypothetical protein